MGYDGGNVRACTLPPGKPAMTEPRDLTLYRAGEELRRGNFSAVDLLESCLERIRAREDTVQAWANLYAEEALELARTLDAEAARHRWQGPLHGLPLGIKDIYDVQGQATEAGTAAYPSRIADQDADSVARLREAGAIVLGKTVTTAFATADPSKTHNPWNSAHTPGGSSAGSGAAVADRMVAGALGTQTNGSVIRPSSFNGVVGFKPSLGRISTEGIIPVSWQLDHVGTLTRSVEDACLLWHLLRDERTLDWQATREKMPPALLPRAPLRVWRLREYFEAEAHAEMRAAMDAFCGELSAQGVEIVERRLPASFAGMHEAHRFIMASECAAVHRMVFEADPTPFPPRISGTIREGLAMHATDYIGALRHRLRLIGQMDAALGDVDCAIYPAAPGPAPKGLESTGNAGFNTLSSICGLPVVTFPLRLSAEGLPVGLQVMGRAGREDDLLGVAAWCESVAAFTARPDAA
jgi:Asp-tRNA(Asn)/Glu-tRNA(Gln) amidotransferase A subunit family amidase